MNIEFDDNAVWVGGRESISFHAKADGKTIKCFVSRETLDDHFGGDNVQDYVPLFYGHRKDIFAVAEKIIQAGLVSQAGELILTTNMFN